ncbi:MAG: C40 family peptidase [Flavobacteriales bacterium]|nr:C40 family peptidase [Flavobacteriales bacterium]
MNKKVICQTTTAPMRAEPKSQSEMISQFLFGELAEIIQQENTWIQLQTTYDNYVGWVDCGQVIEISEEEFNSKKEDVNYVTSPFDYAILEENPFPLTIGAQFKIHQENKIQLADKTFSFDGKYIKNQKLNKEKIAEIAKIYINTPYLWGGKSTFGIDCSGLSQMCYKLCGYYLPRDAYQQAEIGNVINFLDEAEEGDLAFFENEEGKIIHVGILLNDSKIIHAHGKVRIDTIDYNGIYNSETKKYSHKLRVIKKIIE